MVTHTPRSGTGRFIATAFVLASLVATAANGQSLSLRPQSPEQRAKLAERLAQERDDQRREAERYKGMSAKAKPGATGDDLDRQNRIADLLNAMDIVPAQRTERFGWMSSNAHLRITGWYGSILSVVPERRGMIVTLSVGPRHDCDQSFMTTSRTIERYLFSDGKFQFLDLTFKPGVGVWN